MLEKEEIEKDLKIPAEGISVKIVSLFKGCNKDDEPRYFLRAIVTDPDKAHGIENLECSLTPKELLSLYQMSRDEVIKMDLTFLLET